MGPSGGAEALEHAGRKGFLRAGAWRFLKQLEPGTVLEIKAGRLGSGSKPRGREQSVSVSEGHL